MKSNNFFPILLLFLLPTWTSFESYHLCFKIKIKFIFLSSFYYISYKNNTYTWFSQKIINNSKTIKTKVITCWEDKIGLLYQFMFVLLIHVLWYFYSYILFYSYQYWMKQQLYYLFEIIVRRRLAVKPVLKGHVWDKENAGL